MRRFLSIITGLLLLFCTASLWAQNVAKDSDTGKGKKPEKKVKIYTYLGNSNLGGGPIGKQEFDSLLKQGIRSSDTTGTVYRINSFNFSYAERNLYEDSVGNLMIMPDYMMEHCFGDTVTKNISAIIYDKTKAGDTAYFDQIIVVRPDSTTALSEPMKFVITK